MNGKTIPAYIVESEIRDKDGNLKSRTIEKTTASGRRLPLEE